MSDFTYIELAYLSWAIEYVRSHTDNCGDAMREIKAKIELRREMVAAESFALSKKIAEHLILHANSGIGACPMIVTREEMHQFPMIVTREEMNHLKFFIGANSDIVEYMGVKLHVADEEGYEGINDE